jgi:hypothetical protein
MKMFLVENGDCEPLASTTSESEGFSHEPEGVLKTKDKDLRFFAYRETAKVTYGTSCFIENSAKQSLPHCYKAKERENKPLSKRLVSYIEEKPKNTEKHFTSIDQPFQYKKKEFYKEVEHTHSIFSVPRKEKHVEADRQEAVTGQNKMRQELPKIKKTALKSFAKTPEIKHSLFSLAKTVVRKTPHCFIKNETKEQKPSLAEHSTRFSHSQVLHHFKCEEKNPDHGQQKRHEQPQENFSQKKKKVSILSLNGSNKVTAGSLPATASKICLFSPPNIEAPKKIENSVIPMQKKVVGGPQLPLPRLGMIPTYYVLTKIGIISDATGLQSNKEEMDVLNEERDKLHKERMQELTKAQKDALAKKRWGVAMQIMHWLIAFTGLITGIGLLISGTAVLAGSLMLAGGVLAVTNQIMNATGVWDKIVEKLPGQDPEKKRAVVMWMQVGISILAMVLMSGASMFGGFSKTFQIMGTITSMQSAGLTIGHSICMLGMSLTQSKHKARLAEVKGRELLQKKNENRHQDVMDDVKRQQEVHEQLMESLAKWLETQQRDFHATQAGLTR